MGRKVRIKKIPTGAVGISGNLGTKSTQTTGNMIYPMYKPNMMAEPKLEERTTLSPVPRDQANLEAEKGETALLPDVGGLSAHYKIGGKRHSQGGTPLQMPEDAFIFSDTSSMKIKDPKLLAYFGKTNKKGKSGITPADIAKQYDINTYRKTLADSTIDDPIQVRTAENMIANYNLKLAKLGLIQESMKGFPQGIPAIALPYLATNSIDPGQILPLKGSDEMQQLPDQEQFMQDGGPLHAGPQPWANFGNALMQEGGPTVIPSKGTNKYTYTDTRYSAPNTTPDLSKMSLEQLNAYTKKQLKLQEEEQLREEKFRGYIAEQRDRQAFQEAIKSGDFERADQIGAKLQFNTPKDSTYIPPADSTKAIPNTPAVTREQLNKLSSAEQDSVINTLPLSAIEKLMQKQKGGAASSLDEKLKKRLVASKKASATKASNTIPYVTADDPASLKKLMEKYNIIDDPYLFEGTIKSQHKSSSGKGYGEQVSQEQWAKNNKWYLDQRKTQGQPDFDPDNKSHIADFEEELNKKNYSALVSRGLAPEAAKKIVDAVGFIDNPKSIRHKDQKMGEYHKSRTALRFNDPATIPTPAEDVAKEPVKALDTSYVPPIYNNGIEAPWFAQDVIKTAGAAGDFLRIKKYLPWSPVASPYLPDPTFYDPTRELAANAEQANILTQGATAFGSPQRYGAVASSIQGNAAKNVADVLGKYNNLNVGVANQFSGIRADIMNRANESNANNATALYDKTTMANQNFDNSKNMAREQLRTSYIDAITNRANAQVLNTLYPNYHIDPSMGGMLDFYKGSKMRPGSTTDRTDAMIEQAKKIKAAFPDASAIDIMKTLTGKGGFESDPQEEANQEYLKNRGRAGY